MAPRKKRIKYSEESLIKVVAEIKNGAKYREVSSKYGIPVMTLCDKVKGRVPLTSARPGPSSNLSIDQEKRLVSYLLDMANIGYGLMRKDIPDIVKQVLDKAEADGYVIPEGHKFKENRPSNNWIYGFLRRNPEVSARTPENLGFQRSFVTENSLRNWFEGLKAYLAAHHNISASEFFTDENRDRIYNCDETGFPLQGTNGKLKIIAGKGAKNVYKLSSDSKEQVTVLACVSARGNFSKPFVLFPGVKLPKINFHEVNEADYDVGYSQNGWMSTDCFFSWIANLFYPSIQDKVSFPVILFVDGHISHMSLPVAEFCRDHGIILYCFPPHASHIIQPLDVTVFGPVKKLWNKALDEFKLKYKIQMSKAHFFQVFDNAWKATAQKNHGVAGFRCTGLVPFEPNNVDYSKILRKVPAEPPVQVTKSENIAQQKVGISMAFGKITEILSDEQLILFEKRFSEGYDLLDQSNLGKLWQIYREIRIMTAVPPTPKVANVPLATSSPIAASHPSSFPAPKNSHCVPPTFDAPSETDSDHQCLNDAPVSNNDQKSRDSSTTLIEPRVFAHHSNVNSVERFVDAPVKNRFDTSTESPVVALSCAQDTSTSNVILSTTGADSDISQINIIVTDNDRTQIQIDEQRPSSARRCIAEQFECVPSTSSSCDTGIEAIPSTSTQVSNTDSNFDSNHPAERSYDNWQFSPFKKYLKISDATIVTRKFTNTKSKVPPALSGTEYVSNMKKENERKANELKQKDRKRQREEKRKEKETKGAQKKKSRTEEVIEAEDDDDEDSNENIVYAASSDDEIVLETRNVCAACDGNEDWYIDEKWIGCSLCPKWVHKACISGDVENMSPEELSNFDFTCISCQSQKRNKSSKNINNSRKN